MRAAAMLRMLAEWSEDVHLLVIPVYENGMQKLDPEVAVHCATWEQVPDPGRLGRRASIRERLGDWTRRRLPQEWRRCHAGWQQRVVDSCRALEPDIVLVFRFYLWPYLEKACQRQERIWLDLDEMESASRRRLAELCRSKGELGEARRLHREAAAYEHLERALFPRFERLFASSIQEAELARRTHPTPLVQVLPNTYPVDHPCPRRPSGRVFRLLFVGTLGYAPNRDAFEYFAGSILPLLRAEVDRPVELHVAGTGSSSLDARAPGIILHGFVEELAPLYDACDLVVVPLRAGGGTRIKILEAFSHCRAVVSTMIGMEGLEARPGRDLLAAETPEAFAAACLRLLQDESERSRIAEHGYRYFSQYHRPEVLTLAIRAM